MDISPPLLSDNEEIQKDYWRIEFWRYQKQRWSHKIYHSYLLSTNGNIESIKQDGYIFSGEYKAC